MTITAISPIPELLTLPATLPLDDAVRLELVDGVPIFRATATVQNRIELLLDKQKEDVLTQTEVQELDLYEEVDDYLSFVNRVVRLHILTDYKPSCL